MDYKCKSSDCERSEGKCCKSCEELKACQEKNHACIHLDNGQHPADCVYVEVELTKAQLIKFKEYFDELYGEGLEVENWHQNGDTVPFDNFYESAIESMGD